MDVYKAEGRDEMERAERRDGYVDARNGRPPRYASWQTLVSYSRGYRDGLREGFLPDVKPGYVIVRGLSVEQAAKLVVELRHDPQYGMATFEVGAMEPGDRVVASFTSEGR